MSSLKVTLPEELKRAAWKSAHARCDMGRANVSAIVIEALRLFLEVPTDHRCAECRKPERRAQS